VVIDGTTYMVDDINAVDFSEEQGLTEQQQQQGRSNIGAAALAALAGKADKADLDALEGTVGELSDDVDGLTEALADKASAIVDTASGAIASFPDGAAVAAKDVTIGIEPVQSGSGDPSPTNVRPISGWTGAKVANISDSEKQPYFAGLLNGTYGFVDLGTLNWVSMSDGFRSEAFYPAKFMGQLICTKYTRAERPPIEPPWATRSRPFHSGRDFKYSIPRNTRKTIPLK
jgi:hypothetical protein